MITRTHTVCPYCGVGCGLVAAAQDGKLVAVEGDRNHPVNRGRTCPKPLEIASSVHASDRARVPKVRGSRDERFTEVDWDAVLPDLAARLAAYQPHEIAFYISGQLLTEDYYAVNKLAKGVLGTNNVDSNSRLCMSSAVAGYTGAFGADGPPPSYADLALADCLFLLGTNTAACHPIVWGRIRDRRAEGAFVICADPRPTATARESDLHLPVRPGTDLALLNAMLHVIDRDGLVDGHFLEHHTRGWEDARAVAADWTPERAQETCGIAHELIEFAARKFAEAPRAMALWSMGANQSRVGTLKNRALINLCLATGQIGTPGSGPLSLTGQPNAMGGRETGGLSHLLPGYRKVADAADRAAMEAHWELPAGAISSKPGLPAVELFDALADGTVKAVWIVATNPLVSLPRSARAREALERAELVVVQDAFDPTETSAFAHVVLPAAAWPEKEGTMTNSERRVGLVRKVLDPPGKALPDWEIFARVANELGRDFGWDGPADVFAEFAACTAGRPCDLSGLTHEELRILGGAQWGGQRLYADRRFHTPDRRARMAPTPHAGPAEPPTPDFPLVLTTGRVAAHWHTLTRTGKSAKLNAIDAEPFVELSPKVAAGVGDRARVVSAHGEAILRVRAVPGLPDDVAFTPFHWGALHAPAGAGQVNAVTHGAVDPVSRQPELKAVAVRAEPVSDRAVVRRSGKRLVVVGTGMAAMETVEEVLRRGGEWRITMLGEEPTVPYNRMLLSKLLGGSVGPGALELRPPAWFAHKGIDLRGANAAVQLDLDIGRVLDRSGLAHDFDALVIATGSRPFVPPIPGADGPGVLTFRTRSDVAAIEASARSARKAVVIGGGLLGLEAAAGIRACGTPVTVIEGADRLMPQQLDPAAAAMLARALRDLGIDSKTSARVEHIGDLDADLVVIAAGIRPETTLAREAGLEVDRGIVVDDAMRTSAPGVFAVGECAQHRGTVYGLWAPLAEQARVAGAVVSGDPAAFQGATTATNLKVAGVDVFAGGDQEDGDDLVWSDGRRGVYRRLLLRGDRLAGAILVGDTAEARELSTLLRSGEPVPDPLLGPPGVPSVPPQPMPDDVICACNGVDRKTIEDAIVAGGLTSVPAVSRVTRAATGCGSCSAEVGRILSSRSRNREVTEAKPRLGTISA